MQKLSISLGEGLVVVIGDRAATLTPAAGFSLAQRLIRRATSALVAQQVAHDRQRLRPAVRKMSR